MTDPAYITFFSRKWFFRLAALLMLAGSHAYAQSGAPAEPASSNIRYFDREKLENYRQDDDFQYDRDTRTASPGLWDRIQRWLMEKLYGSLQDRQTRTFWKWVIFIGCGLVILYVILKLTNTPIRGAFAGSARANRITFTEHTENIHEMNFDQLITEAISRQAYNIAVRYSYLKTLKQLTDQHLIEWRPDKTNNDYLRELTNRPEETAFRQVTVLFEYIYYGNFTISQAEFEQARAVFASFNAQVRKAA